MPPVVADVYQHVRIEDQATASRIVESQAGNANAFPEITEDCCGCFNTHWPDASLIERAVAAEATVSSPGTSITRGVIMNIRSRCWFSLL